MDVASFLPEEILAFIFQHISDAELFHHRYLDDVLSICRRWRAAALNHSRLWARIIIDIEADNRMGVYDSRVRYILRRLFLSGTAPLAIEISMERFYDTHCGDPTCGCQYKCVFYAHDCYNTVKYFAQARRLISLVVGRAGEHMARWRSLSIDFSVRFFESREYNLRNMRLLEYLKHPTPVLKMLSLNGVEGSFKTLLPYSPSLTHCKFEINGKISDFNVPWSSLRSLELSKYSVYTEGRVFLHIPECIRLESLCITNSARWCPNTLESLKDANPFNCILPSLLSFELLCFIPFDMASFNLPALIDLTLAIPDSFRDPQGDARIMQKITHLSTLAANATKLKLLHTQPATHKRAEYQAPKARLIEMLKCMPKLEEIYLPSTLYLCVHKTLKQNLDIVPHLERIFLIPEKGRPILMNGKGFMTKGKGTNWRTSIPLLLPALCL